MLIRATSAEQILEKNARLEARVKMLEHLDTERLQLKTENQKLKEENAQLKTEIGRTTESNVLLKEQVEWLKAQYFGRSSQVRADEPSADQKLLFNEAEVLAAIEAANEAHRNRTTKIDAHERKHTGGRKAIPKHFPRIEVVHDLSEAEKMCTVCPVPHPLKRMSEQSSECYRFEPPKLSVEKHIRPIYVCEERQEDVRIAPVPATILPKTQASPSLLAHLITSKFVDGLPIYRVVRQLMRCGADLHEGTVGTWVNIVGGEKVTDLIALMNERLLKAPFLHMDETYLQVLKSDKAVDADHFIVVRAGGPEGQRLVLYDYIASRTREALKQLLIGSDGPYRGKLMTDGLERYDEICLELNLLHFACWQHCRAYFYKANKVSEQPSSRSLALVAIEDYIRQLYSIERKIKALRDEAAGRGETLPSHIVLELRQKESVPIMAAFKAWVDKLSPGVPPKSALGKALAYTCSQWTKLCRYAQHAEMPIDNNYSEQQARTVAIGRKAWLFCDSKVGAQASANLYSLTATARANGVEPFAYLQYLFEQLPTAKTPEALEALLPWIVQRVFNARKAQAAA